MLFRSLLRASKRPTVSRVASRLFSDQKAPSDADEVPIPAGWDESEGDMDWEDLENQFGSLDGEEGDFRPEDLTGLSTQDISEMSERPPYEMDEEHPPKLKKIHYHMVKDINPELFEQWVSLRTVQWKLQNKLKPLSKYQFSTEHLDEYDKMPEWSKPGPRRQKPRCELCIPDESDDKVKQITFTNLELLHEYVNERGQIINRRVSGNCGFHQRKIAKAIKQARLAGLMAFTSNWKIPQTFLEPQSAAELEAPLFPEAVQDFSEGTVTEVTLNQTEVHEI